MRSLLFVPADSPRKLARAADSGADALIIDLEDSVALASKDAAREAAATTLAEAGRGRDSRLIVRTNALESDLIEADLDAVVSHRPDAIMLPKSRSGADAAACSAMIAEREREAGLPVGGIGLLVIATETATSLFSMGSYGATLPRLTALTWGAEDLSADLGATGVRDADGALTGPYALARTLTLVAARAVGVEPIDGIYAAFRDLDGLAREAEDAARDGFVGKLAIHPSQIAPINKAFTPSGQAVERAQTIVAAFEAEPGAGVVAIDGQMVDRPHLVRAERLLARARDARIRGPRG